MATVRDQLQVLIAEALSVPAEKITPDAHIQNDLGADSLDVVEMVMELEEHLQIDIPDEEQKGLETVGQLYAYLASKGINLDAVAS